VAKGKSKPPVVFNKKAFLLPKMEVFWIDEAAGEGFYLRELGGEAMLSFLEAVNGLKKDKSEDAELQPHEAFELMSKFVVLAACDEQAKPIFTEDDIPLLREKNPNIILDIANKAMPMSGLNPAVIGEVAVNLKNDPPNFSATDLPMNSESQ
jgi:hypothetical protein